MEVSFYLSAGAILISISSLTWSIHIGRRDRGKLKATSKFYQPAPGYGSPYLKVKAVNHGRRPVILTMLGSDFSDGSSSTMVLKNHALRLGENEAYEEDLRVADGCTMTEEGEEAIDLWFEDTLGRRHKVENAKENLRKLLGKD